ncbi:hypothetical protein CC85DRAFT_37788 [Cutaneotrichosporon oleaginosum]|uniref:Uncharacterized protein n=1 Tax=Cutaneotrichosporon oleaginosum TaxID=879819 RepID=A0A0J0XB64_9TREE|nr:uncharacterized protein CC85DRAFT_37788 [Cutaneotrichosporon oleaginosum]KLT38352.1 hypothetical protein CC85DRAFT_37788 [Cutaneotrichosporon oleaginosum]
MEPRPSSASHTSAADIGDLLDGLGADDFNDDFDDDFIDPPSSHRQTLFPSPLPPPPLRPPHPPEDDDFYEPPAPTPAHIPEIVSFATGRGRQLARPSEVAMNRALKLVRAAERDAELEDEPNKRPRTESPKPIPHLSQLPPSSVPESPLVGRGFGLASGRPAPPQNEASRARALALFGENTPLKSGQTVSQLDSRSDAAPPPADPGSYALSLLGEGTPVKQRVSVPGFQLGTGYSAPPPAGPTAPALALFGEETPIKQTSSGFQLGSGSSAPQTSAGARARALALFGENAGSSTGASLGFSTGSGKPTQAPKPESLAFAMALMADDPPTSTVVPESAATPQRPSTPAFSAPRYTTSFSAPMRTPSRVPLAGLATPRSTSKLSNRINIQTPGSTPRRIGLGATFGHARTKPKNGFITPFKRGAKTVPGPLMLRAPLSVHTPSRPPRTPNIYKSVFDLTPPPHRKGMRESFLYPGFYKPAELAEFGL